MDIYERIKLMRKQRGMSQEELADRVGVSRQAVSKWESGLNIPDPDKIILLSSVLGVTTDYLLLGKEEENQNEDIEPAAEETVEEIPLQKKKRLSKKAKVLIITAILALAVAIGIYFYNKADTTLLGIYYSPNGKSALVVNTDTIGKGDERVSGFRVRQYDGLRGTKSEYFILKHFPYEASNLGFSGIFQAITWLPDGTGYLLEYYDWADTEVCQYKFVSLTNDNVNYINLTATAALYNELGKKPKEPHYNYYNCLNYKISFLMFYQREAVFYYEFIDEEENFQNGFFFMSIDELTKIQGKIDAVVQQNKKLY